MITGYCMAISCCWNMPAHHRLWVGIMTVVFIFMTIIFNVVRWILFVMKYLKLRLLRFISRKIRGPWRKWRRRKSKKEKVTK